jgi:hypothetical protein
LFRTVARWMLCLTLAGLLVSALLYWASAQAAAHESPSSFSFVLTADIRNYAGEPYDSSDFFRGAAEAIARLGPTAFMISPGDIDPPHEIYRVITQTLGLTYTWYPVVGNHELPGEGNETDWVWGANMFWLQAYDYGPVNPGPSGCPTTTYSFDVQNAHLVVLNEYCDSTDPWVTDGTIPDHLYDWLEQDLQATDKTHSFVIGHEPAYPQPDADNGRERHMTDSLNADPARRDRFWTLLQQEGVTAYLCGHTHNYSVLYLDGVWQVDVGHARGLGDTGAPSTFVVVHVEGDLVTFEAYRDAHDGDYDYDDIIHRGTLAPMWYLSFQDGTASNAGYAGTRDAYVDADSTTANYGSATPLVADGSPDRAALLRWDVTDIPTGSQVLSASVVLHVTDTTYDTYDLYEIASDWIESQVTWDERATGVPWQLPGAQGVQDRSTEIVGAITASSTGTYVIDLNLGGIAMVERWIDDPSTNHGLIVTHYDRGDSVQFASREAAAASERPRLNLLIAPSRLDPWVAIAGPTTGTLEAGHVFTAFVHPVQTSLPITYEWRATDQETVLHFGSPSLTDTQAYTWTLEGPKKITVTAHYSGGVVTDTHAITISRLRNADLIAWPRWGRMPLTVAFTNTSTCSYTTSLWQFGDGVTSTLSAPIHTYVNGGLYTVTLTVSGTDEVCTVTKPRYISVYYENMVFVPFAARNH